MTENDNGGYNKDIGLMEYVRRQAYNFVETIRCAIMIRQANMTPRKKYISLKDFLEKLHEGDDNES
jgi:hypothetical protein